jgi:hypothetical protein
MDQALSEKLLSFNHRLTAAESANFKLILGLAAGGLAPGFQRSREGVEGQAFSSISKALAGLQPFRDRIPSNGVAFRGRPEFISGELLSILQQEASTARKDAVTMDGHYLGFGAPRANELAVSSQLTEFVCGWAGTVKPSGIASFLFYEREGQGIDPHIDTDIFSLNVLMMLNHTKPAGLRPSALVVFPPDGEPERLELEPGDMVIFFAGSIAHGRGRMRLGESVSILTFGFHPLGI